jgi:hypothetical protein
MWSIPKPDAERETFGHRMDPEGEDRGGRDHDRERGSLDQPVGCDREAGRGAAPRTHRDGQESQQGSGDRDPPRHTRDSQTRPHIGNDVDDEDGEQHRRGRGEPGERQPGRPRQGGTAEGRSQDESDPLPRQQSHDPDSAVAEDSAVADVAGTAKLGSAPKTVMPRPFGSSHSSWRPRAVRSSSV